MMTLEQIKICQRLGLDCNWALQNYSYHMTNKLRQTSLEFGKYTADEKETRKMWQQIRKKSPNYLKQISKNVDETPEGTLVLNGTAEFYKNPEYYFVDSPDMDIAILIDRNADLEKIADMYRIKNQDKAMATKNKNRDKIAKEISRMVNLPRDTDLYVFPLYTVVTEKGFEDWQQLSYDKNCKTSIGLICIDYSPYSSNVKVSAASRAPYDIKKYNKDGTIAKI